MKPQRNVHTSENRIFKKHHSFLTFYTVNSLIMRVYKVLVKTCNNCVISLHQGQHICIIHNNVYVSHSLLLRPVRMRAHPPQIWDSSRKSVCDVTSPLLPSPRKFISFIIFAHNGNYHYRNRNRISLTTTIMLFE